jgi:UDP-2,3-diacylglucosamine hydrolase
MNRPDTMTAHVIPVRSALLVSDVHLAQEHPALAQSFSSWLRKQVCVEDFSAKDALSARSASEAPKRGHANQADHPEPPQCLFILGDLVDAWVGDDQLNTLSNDSIEAQLVHLLRSISSAGISVYLMHGNRDFLFGPQFATATGATLLQDPTVIEIGLGTKDSGQTALRRILMTHGDQLCTHDTEYQAFRQQVRDPAWQAAFLAKPLGERLTIAQQLRQTSETEKAGKSMAIMDITPDAAVALTERYAADALIHGHTHRPGHTVMRNGKSRWVLPDWETDHQENLIRGGGLWVDSSGVQSIPA